MAEIAVAVEHLTKQFKIPLEASTGIKQKLINALKGIKGYREFSPLNDISFEIQKGDFFGIVGRNGSGKSTLLKTIAGIYAPNRGRVQVTGKLVPFIELGVGFNPELTGRENVFLNGALLGFSRAEMQAMYADIVAFAELDNFMEERLKNYSSGMQVRLAFSIAIRAEGDILLLDEVLAVGDEAFQKKCFTYFQSLKNDKKTVILVTHDMNSVREYCNKAILLDQGKIIESGSAEKVSVAYSEMFNPRVHQEAPETRWGTGEITFTEVLAKAPTDEALRFAIAFQPVAPITTDVLVSYILKDEREQALVSSTFRLSQAEAASSQPLRYILSIPNVFHRGDYFLDISVKAENADADADVWVDSARVTISNGPGSKTPLNITATLQPET